MRYRATIRDFIDLLHVFPTMSEALKIVAISRFENPATLASKLTGLRVRPTIIL